MKMDLNWRKVCSCSLCKGVGHNIITCLRKEELLGKSNHISKYAAKKKKVILENQDLNPIHDNIISHNALCHG